MSQRTSIKRVAMVSTHGYFDPEPQLGRTDTGGQVVYVLQLARALTRLGIQADIFTRWFDRDRQQVDPLPDCPEVRVIRISGGPWDFIPKEQIYRVLPELAASTGSACHAGLVELSPVLKALGVPEEEGMGAIRFSLGRATTKQEIDRLLDMLKPFSRG